MICRPCCQGGGTVTVKEIKLENFLGRVVRTVVTYIVAISHSRGYRYATHVAKNEKVVRALGKFTVKTKPLREQMRFVICILMAICIAKGYVRIAQNEKVLKAIKTFKDLLAKIRLHKEQVCYSACLVIVVCIATIPARNRGGWCIQVAHTDRSRCGAGCEPGRD